MRLSDAIRLGAMLHPQCFGVSAKKDNHGTTIATCALGAAHEAGYQFAADSASQLVYFSVASLNDQGQTREHIADWLDRIERREESAAVDASDPHVPDPGTLTTRV